jgi:hypothetical protein
MVDGVGLHAESPARALIDAAVQVRQASTATPTILRMCLVNLWGAPLSIVRTGT